MRTRRQASPGQKDGGKVKGQLRNDATAKAWLNGLAVRGRPWRELAILAGVLQGVGVIVMAALLAALIHGLVMDGKSLAELAAYWYGLPFAFAWRALAGWAREEAGARAAAKIRAALRRDLLDQVQALGPAWVAGQTGGGLVSTLLEQVDGLDGYFARYRPQMFIAVLIPLLILGVVFSLNWAAGLILLLTAPLIPVFMILVGMGTQARQARQLQMLTRMSGHFLDLVRGLGDLRLLDAHRAQTPRVAAVAEEFRVRTMSVLRMAFLSSTVLEFFASVSIAMLAVYLGFSLLGHLDFGYYDAPPDLALSFFILLLAPEFYLPLRELGTHYHARAEALAAAEQLQPIFAASSPQCRGGSLQPADKAPAIRLQRLSFAHQPGVPVLRELSLDLAAGASLAIVGNSGAGKTTLLRLILGELSAPPGAISIDGRPLEELDAQAWREGIAWMSQHPRLLPATLADNLRLARHDADEAAMHEALAFAELLPWFATLPEGWQTRLGEGGRLLSGGQLRRLALARVHLRRARLLLLDEPTASLDSATEALVMAGLQRLAEGRTLLLLTHRSAALQLVERVALLDGGRLVAEGEPGKVKEIDDFLAGACA